MNVQLKITAKLLRVVRNDLQRPHPFAAERVGFLSCGFGAAAKSRLVVLAREFHPVADEDYLNDHRAAAMMGPAAIRKALQFAFNNGVGMFHVHLHAHPGRPWLSSIDLKESAQFVPDFWHVRPELAHGAIVLSLDSVAGLCWYPGVAKPIRIKSFTSAGAPMQFIRG